jgi:hypothetical protein
VSEHYVAFIDIMFAVMVAESFASFKDELFAPSFNLVVLVASYLTILTSWIFYHKSLDVLPEKGPWRFVLDVCILFAYFVLITTHRSFDTIVLVYPVLWVLYLFWDALKSREYPQRKLSILWSVPYIGTFAIIALVHSAIGQISIDMKGISISPNWFELSALIVTIVVYRARQNRFHSP